MDFSSGFLKSARSILVLSVALAGCLPPALAKYRDQNGSKKNESLALDSLVPSRESPPPVSEEKFAQTAKAHSHADVGSPAKDPSPSLNRPESAGIYAIDPQTFRVVAREEEVWEATLDVLLKHYTLTIVDHQSGIISTEWDTFMKGTTAYRNKLSLRLRKSGRNGVDLTIRNNVERLRGMAEGAGALGGVWLPSEDPVQEVRRVVQNLALILELPPPVFPPEQISSRGSGQAAQNLPR